MKDAAKTLFARPESSNSQNSSCHSSKKDRAATKLAATLFPPACLQRQRCLLRRQGGEEPPRRDALAPQSCCETRQQRARLGTAGQRGGPAGGGEKVFYPKNDLCTLRKGPCYIWGRNEDEGKQTEVLQCFQLECSVAYEFCRASKSTAASWQHT